MARIRGSIPMVATSALLLLSSLALAGTSQTSSVPTQALVEGQPTKFLDPVRVITADLSTGPRLGTHIDIAVNAAGELFVADPDHRRLLWYNPRTRRLVAFRLGLERTRSFYPTGIAIDSAGRIIVANQDRHELLIFDRAGGLLGTIGGDGSPLERPLDLAIDANDHVYVLEGLHRQVQVWSLDGRLKRVFKLPSGTGPISSLGEAALAVGGDGLVYVAGRSAGGVIRLFPDGRMVALGKLGGREWQSPQGLAVDSDSHVYVSDYHSYAIAEFSADGEFLQDHVLAKERLKQPTRMIVVQHALYVVNEGNGEIIQFAIRSARKAIEHAILGEEFIALREYTKAVGELTVALNLGYGQAEAHYLLGLAYSALDQLTAAVEQFRMATVKDPSAVEAFVQLGNVLTSLNDSSAASLQYQEALRLNPQHLAARLALGEVYLRMGHPAKAEEQFEVALRLGSGEVPARIGVGRVRLAQRDYGAAERALREALQAAPQSREAIFYLGQTYLQGGRYAEAVSLLEESVRRGPFFVEAFYHLGLGYAALGDRTKAVQSFRRALEIQPKHVGAGQALRKYQ